MGVTILINQYINFPSVIIVTVVSFILFLFVGVSSISVTNSPATFASDPLFASNDSNTTRATTAFPTRQTAFPVRVTPAPDPNKRTLLVCELIERSRGDRSVFYDFDRVSSAIDIAVDYANKQLLLNGYQIQTYYQDIGKTCTKKNDAVKYALEVFTKGVNCNAYLGPGQIFSFFPERGLLAGFYGCSKLEIALNIEFRIS